MIDGSPASREISLDCSVALRFVFQTQQQRLNCVDVFISMRSTASAAAWTPVLNFASSLLMMFFVQPLFINSVINCRAL